MTSATAGGGLITSLVGSSSDDSTLTDAKLALTKVLMGIEDDREKGEAQFAEAGSQDFDPAIVLKMLDVKPPPGTGLKGAQAYAANYEQNVNARLAKGQKFSDSSLKGLSVNQANQLDFADFEARANQGLEDAIGGILGADPRTQSGIGTAVNDAMNAISNPNGTGSLDMIRARIADTSSQMDSISEQMQHETDPATLDKLYRKFEVLQAEREILRKEEEKQYLIRELMWQLIIGAPNPSTLRRLKEMGLGFLVEQLARKAVEHLRAHGGVPRQMIEALQAAGFGAVVAQDADELRLRDDHEHNLRMGFATTAEERQQQKDQMESRVDASRATSRSLASQATVFASQNAQNAAAARARLSRAIGLYGNSASVQLGLTQQLAADVTAAVDGVDSSGIADAKAFISGGEPAKPVIAGPASGGVGLGTHV